MSAQIDKTDQQRAAVALLFNAGVLSKKEANDLIYKISVLATRSLIETATDLMVVTLLANS